MTLLAQVSEGITETDENVILPSQLSTVVSGVSGVSVFINDTRGITRLNGWAPCLSNPWTTTEDGVTGEEDQKKRRGAEELQIRVSGT